MNAKLEFNRHIHNYAKQAESWVVNNIYSDFVLDSIKLDWNPKRRSHRGGYYADGPGINMAMALLPKTPKGITLRFYEYRSFDTDPHIGGFYTDDSNQHNQAIVLHEVAHAVQFYSYKINNTRCKPHGPMFKNFYKRLRQGMLNPYLPNQQLLKKDYEDYLKKLQRRA